MVVCLCPDFSMMCRRPCQNYPDVERTRCGFSSSCCVGVVRRRCICCQGDGPTLVHIMCVVHDVRGAGGCSRGFPEPPAAGVFGQVAEALTEGTVVQCVAIIPYFNYSLKHHCEFRCGTPLTRATLACTQQSLCMTAWHVVAAQGSAVCCVDVTACRQRCVVKAQA